MPKAYDRVKNADNHSDMFIKTPYWTNDVEAQYEIWREQDRGNSFHELCDLLLESECAVSFRLVNGSTCATLAHQPSKDAGLPYLLTGWSDNVEDALEVARYKLEVMMQGIWEAPKLAPAPRRR
jgi:hypothetical protein